jgi:hypothetical protein
MATRRKPVEPNAEPPSAEEMHDVIERWRVARHTADVARQLEDESRREMVELLHRAGLNGFVL